MSAMDYMNVRRLIAHMRSQLENVATQTFWNDDEVEVFLPEDEWLQMQEDFAKIYFDSLVKDKLIENYTMTKTEDRTVFNVDIKPIKTIDVVTLNIVYGTKQESDGSMG